MIFKVPLTHYPLDMLDMQPLYLDGQLNPDCAWVTAGKGRAMAHFDGLPVLLYGGQLYRPTAKKWTHYNTDAGREALHRYPGSVLKNGVYILLGRDINGNPYHWEHHRLIIRGSTMLKHTPPYTYDGLAAYFEQYPLFGVAWFDGDRRACIDRTAFGFVWPDWEHKALLKEWPR